MRYQIIGSPKTRTFRVLWMFEELGVEYELVRERPRSEAVLRYNPGGKVPVLLADDEPILDSVAILQYLADSFGRFTHKAGTIERARQDSFTQFAVDDLETPCWNHAKHSFILPEELRCEAAKPAFKYEFDNAQAVLEARLGDRPFVTGNDFTVPDLVIGHIAGWAKNNDYDWRPGPVARYFERLRSRPAFAEAWKIREMA